MISLTNKAIEEITRIKNKEKDPAHVYLRVRVTGGGCSGMSYKLDFETTPPTPQDKLFVFGTVQVVIDQKSILFLKGTELDFSDGLNGKGFVFSNPNAKKTCGCGNSFSA